MKIITYRTFKWIETPIIFIERVFSTIMSQLWWYAHYKNGSGPRVSKPSWRRSWIETGW